MKDESILIIFLFHPLILSTLLLFLSGRGPGLRPLLVAVPCGSLPAVPLPGRALPAALAALRVLQPGVSGPLLPERRHQPHPVQHHVLEVQERGGAALRRERQPPAARTHGQHGEGRRLDGIHCQLLNVHGSHTEHQHFFFCLFLFLVYFNKGCRSADIDPILD